MKNIKIKVKYEGQSQRPTEFQVEYEINNEKDIKVLKIYRSEKMEFEENLNKMYQEIANKINEMIPAEWEQVYTKAYIDDEGGEVLFYYTKLGNNDLHYYTNIPRDYNVSEKIFSDLWDDLLVYLTN